MPKAVVIYYSKTGHTKKMAQAIAKGIQAAKVSADLKEVAKARIEDMLDADAVVLGSPCYYGTMAAEMKAFLDASVKEHGRLARKVGGAFSSAGMLGGGAETTVMSLLKALLIHGMVIQGQAKIAHYGPVAIGNPDAGELDECVKYGKGIGELTLKLAR